MRKIFKRITTAMGIVMSVGLLACGSQGNTANNYIYNSPTGSGSATMSDKLNHAWGEEDTDGATKSFSVTETRAASKSENVTESKNKTDEWVNAYANYLQNYKSSYRTPTKFILAYIDDDDIPELLTCEDNSHANGVIFHGYSGVGVVKCGTFGGYGAVSVALRQNSIMTGDMHQGIEYTRFYEFKNNVATSVKYFIATDVDIPSKTVYKIDSVEVSQKQYQDGVKEYSSKLNYASIDYSRNMKELNANNIASLRNDFESFVFN